MADYGPFKRLKSLFEAIPATIEITQEVSGERILHLRDCECKNSTDNIMISDLVLKSKPKSEPEKKCFPSSNCKEKEQLTAKLIHEEKIINHKTTEVVDETLEESDNRSESIIANQIEAMNTDLINSDIGDQVGRAKKSKFNCKACGKNFSSPFGVKRHISLFHEGKKPFSCDKCSKCFALKDELRKHREGVHEEKNYSCNANLTNSDIGNHVGRAKKSKVNCKACGKNFSSESAVKRHISSVHEKEKPFSCDECPKCFATKDQKRRHRETVHEKKTYPCSQCDKELKSNDSLTRHIKTVHEGQRINICVYCNKAYGKKSDLKRHLDKQHKHIEIGEPNNAQ